MIFQKIDSDIFEWFPCCFSLLYWAGLQILHPVFNSVVWGPMNTPSLILASLVLGNLFFKYINPMLFWSIALTKFFYAVRLVSTQQLPFMVHCFVTGLVKLDKFTRYSWCCWLLPSAFLLSTWIPSFFRSLLRDLQPQAESTSILISGRIWRYHYYLTLLHLKVMN